MDKDGYILESSISVTFAAMEGNLFRTAIHYGSYSGLAVILFNIVLYISNFSLFGASSVLGIWIPVVFLVMATRFHRDHNLGGALQYKQGLSIGFMTTLFSVLLFGLLFYLFGTLVDNSLLDSYKVQASASLEEGKSLLSDKMMDKAMESIDSMTMASLAFSEAFNKFIGGVIATLVISAIFNRKPPTIQHI